MEANALLHTSKEEQPYADINMSHIRVGGEAVGLLFAAGTVYIFFVGIPVARWFLAGAVAVGTLLSIGLGLFHKYRPTPPLARITR